MTRQRLAILGATGSVGLSTLDVAARHPDRFEVYAVTGQRRLDELAAVCRTTDPRYAVVGDACDVPALRERLAGAGLRTEVLWGAEALCDIAAHPEVDIVMAAIVGAAGLPSCLVAARAGKRLLLANKEALVLGGRFFTDAVRQGGATLLTVDSEHSAILQCLPEDRSRWDERIERIVLTASGGPFRGRPMQALRNVTPEQACAHPNWAMGRKISCDSATMMNKALEVIEAHHLFDLPPERIDVVIHPQSVIHSMVVCRDQSVLAQLGTPDMRVPIAVGLAWPARIESGTAPLDWKTMSALTFEPADHATYPALRLAYAALRAAPGTSAVLNAANEEAVAAFFAGTIGFDRILTVAEETVEALPPGDAARTLEGLMQLDAEARSVARRLIARPC